MLLSRKWGQVGSAPYPECLLSFALSAWHAPPKAVPSDTKWHQVTPRTQVTNVPSGSNRHPSPRHGTPDATPLPNFWYLITSFYFDLDLFLWLLHYFSLSFSLLIFIMYVEWENVCVVFLECEWLRSSWIGVTVLLSAPYLTPGSTAQVAPTQWNFTKKDLNYGICP